MSKTQDSEGSVHRQEIHLPMTTIIRLLLAVLFVACLKVLAPLLLTLFLAVLVATSLEPVVLWLEAKGCKRIYAISLVTFLFAGSLAAIMSVVAPSLFTEFSNFIANIPHLKKQFIESLSSTNPLRSVIEHSMNQSSGITNTIDVAPLYSAGHIAFDGITEIILIFVFSIYLLIDGKSAIAWLIAFFSESNQEKINKTITEVSPIIFSYVAGQLITSLFAFFYVLIILSCFGVPNALLLASLAGIFDVLPVLGFFLAVIPAMLFALSVSGSTAIMIFFLYVLYHLIENYFIVPAVYGKRLRVSGFVVLLALIVAGLLTGIEGAIAVLPIVASYPIIERIWLKKIVGKATVDEHRSPAVP